MSSGRATARSTRRATRCASQGRPRTPSSCMTHPRRGPTKAEPHGNVATGDPAADSCADEEDQVNDETSGTTPQLTRRTFLQGSAVAGLGVFLAACTGVDKSAGPSTGAGASQAPGATASIAIPTPPPVSPTPTSAPTPKVVTGPLKFANWAAYIDLTGKAYDTGKY